METLEKANTLHPLSRVVLLAQMKLAALKFPEKKKDLREVLYLLLRRGLNSFLDQIATTRGISGIM